MISCYLELRLEECYQAMPLEESKERICYTVALNVMTTFDRLNGVDGLRHNALATSASADITKRRLRYTSLTFLNSYNHEMMHDK